jgi:hypothetical protein
VRKNQEAEYRYNKLNIKPLWIIDKKPFSDFSKRSLKRENFSEINELSVWANHLFLLIINYLRNSLSSNGT